MSLKNDFASAGYQLVDNLGGGGQAKLYRVTKLGEDQPVYAAKVLTNVGNCSKTLKTGAAERRSDL